MLGLGVGFYKLAPSNYHPDDTLNGSAHLYDGSSYYHSNYGDMVTDYGIYNFDGDPNGTIYGFSWWMKPNDGRPGSSQIIMYYFQGGANHFIVSLGPAGNIVVEHYANGAKGSTQSSSAVFTDGAQSNWTHLVLTVASEGEESNIAMDLKVNGSNHGMGSSSLSSSNAISFSGTSTNQYFGATSSGGNAYAGLLDEIAFYNTTPNVSGLYNSGNGANPMTVSPAPVLCWRAEGDFVDSVSGHVGTNSGVTFETDPDELKTLV